MQAIDSITQPNLVLAWLWLLLGFVSGMALGLFFHDENWLGGYASRKRRLYRLGHISCFGLGAVNLLFHLTLKGLSVAGTWVALASWAFVLGAVTMPVCCVLMAHFPKARMLFAVPVLSLLAGGVLTLTLVMRSAGREATYAPEVILGLPGPHAQFPGTLRRGAAMTDHPLTLNYL